MLNGQTFLSRNGKTSGLPKFELLGIQRARLYRLRKDWLRRRRRGEVFRLWNRSRSDFHRLSGVIEDWLHQELEYIRNGAEVYRGRFNFAFLGEMAEKEFRREFNRSVLRRFALRHGYCRVPPKRKKRFIFGLRG